MSTEVLDLFCEWFEGRFDNWTQASSNPTKWAHIFVTHEKIGDRKYRTSNRYNYQPDKPYREQEVEVTAPWVLGATEDIIIVKNPVCDQIFSFIEKDSCFVGGTLGECTYKGKPLISKAKLYQDAYHSWDVGWWQSAEGYFIFDKDV